MQVGAVAATIRLRRVEPLDDSLERSSATSLTVDAVVTIAGSFIGASAFLTGCTAFLGDGAAVFVALYAAAFVWLGLPVVVLAGCSPLSVRTLRRMDVP